MREKTFFAQLCLVQVAARDRVYCIDPLAGNPMQEFWDETFRKTWVVHSARQDIEVIFQSSGAMPAKLFDTQIAAALLGMQPQIGYAGLVKQLFDVDIPKSHTRADWSRRPLADALLHYAVEDVEYLLPAYDRLGERLEKAGRMSWAEQDSALLLDESLHGSRARGTSAGDDGRRRNASQCGGKPRPRAKTARGSGYCGTAHCLISRTICRIRWPTSGASTACPRSL